MAEYKVQGNLDLVNTVEGVACLTVEAADIPTAVRVVEAAFTQVGLTFTTTAVELVEEEE